MSRREGHGPGKAPRGGPGDDTEEAGSRPGARGARTGRAESGGSAGPGTGRTAADSPDSATEVFYCDLCGSRMLNLHCKLICETCGYKRDCSDP